MTSSDFANVLFYDHKPSGEGDTIVLEVLDKTNDENEVANASPKRRKYNLPSHPKPKYSEDVR